MRCSSVKVDDDLDAHGGDGEASTFVAVGDVGDILRYGFFAADGETAPDIFAYGLLFFAGDGEIVALLLPLDG